jgi:ATP-binding cassette subfamily C protein LapB
MDRESGDIDVELSEFFFARLLAVGLDARPPSVGTLAAQLRGLDIVRGLMTSASFLILADLPFALLFIAAIAGIGGSVALVPLTVFPIALITAFIFAALIRRDAEKMVYWWTA